MQGIFRPPRDGAGNRPPPLDTTGVSWAENLSHPQIRRSRLPAPPADLFTAVDPHPSVSKPLIETIPDADPPAS